MRRAVSYILILMAAMIGAIIVLLAWSFHADQQRFRAASNDCERGCIQDSGGLDSCRKICLAHPNRYP